MMTMWNRRQERNFLNEKLRMVRKVLQQLKKDKEIEGIRRSGSFSFARRIGVDFYVVYIDGVKYVGRPLWIARNGEGEEIENKKTIRVSLFENEASLRKRILETIKRL